MQTHYIKILNHFAQAVYDGIKTFEIRKNDRGYQSGDKVVFRVVDEVGIAVAHPLSQKAYLITYVLHGYGLKDGYCVFGIKERGEETNG